MTEKCICSRYVLNLLHVALYQTLSRSRFTPCRTLSNSLSLSCVYSVKKRMHTRRYRVPHFSTGYFSLQDRCPGMHYQIFSFATMNSAQLQVYIESNSRNRKMTTPSALLRSSALSSSVMGLDITSMAH